MPTYEVIVTETRMHWVTIRGAANEDAAKARANALVRSPVPSIRTPLSRRKRCRRTSPTHGRSDRVRLGHRQTGPVSPSRQSQALRREKVLGKILRHNPDTTTDDCLATLERWADEVTRALTQPPGVALVRIDP
jgi:hypothetical protein